MGTRLFLVTSIISMLFFVSCTSTKNIAYFQNGKDTTFRPMLGTIEAPIQKNDILDIIITSPNKVASSDFNTDNTVNKGYLVNNDGMIQMPTLGNIPAAGLTKTQLKENIRKQSLHNSLVKK